MSACKQRKLDAIYAGLPVVACQRKCQDACGPVLMSREEAKRIRDRLGYEPRPRADLQCPMLGEDGACMVYDIRPLVCRLYGSAEGLPCPHGCAASRTITDSEARATLRAVMEAGR